MEVIRVREVGVVPVGSACIDLRIWIDQCTRPESRIRQVHGDR
jgi:hypothetical protein